MYMYTFLPDENKTKTNLPQYSLQMFVKYLQQE